MDGRMKRMVAVLIVAVLLSAGLALNSRNLLGGGGPKVITIDDVLGYTSKRKGAMEDAVIIEENPYYGLAATPLAAWYDISGGDNGSGLRPLLVAGPSGLTPAQEAFLRYAKVDTVLVVGSVPGAPKASAGITGTPAAVSIALAKHDFQTAAGALLVPYGRYEAAVAAAPLASYLNIPVLIVMKHSEESVKRALGDLKARYVIVAGKAPEAAFAGLPVVPLASHEETTLAAAKVLRSRFGGVRYAVMTNPGDTIPPYVKAVNETKTTDTINNVRALVVGRGFDVMGSSSKTYDINVPDGINWVQISLEITKLEDPLKPGKEAAGVTPIVNLELKDGQGNILAFSPSIAMAPSKAGTETLTVNAPGSMVLGVDIYYGTKGFGPIVLPGDTGFSRIKAEYELTVRTTTLARPHMPMAMNLSMLAPYIAAAHGGFVVADSHFEMTCDNYTTYANGSMTYPAYNSALMDGVNAKVDRNTRFLNDTLDILKKVSARDGNGTMYDSYTNGTAWLAIVADANMVPMYYYEPETNKDYPWGGLGLPGDNAYMLNYTLSAARTMAANTGDLSALIARTLFYEKVVAGYEEELQAKYGRDNDWKKNYMFLFGEGGGQTGWFFWQREFGKEVAGHGFNSEQYGYTWNNDRQTLERLGAFDRANYFEFMTHGNWYWFVPEVNGPDIYSTSVKNTDISNYALGPGMWMTAACLMGRVDVMPLRQSIAMNFIASGLNGFVGSTRSTGSESGTRWMEWDLLYNDSSSGEALRHGKRVHQDEPTIYVRTLFGDPAFNPYEPENGFSDQGRPKMADGKHG